MLGAPGEVVEEPGRRVQAALEQRRLDPFGAARVGRLAGQARHRTQAEGVGDVDPYVLDVLVVGGRDVVRAPPEPPVARDEAEVAGPMVRVGPVDGVVLRAVVEPRLVGQQDLISPSPSTSRSRASQSRCASSACSASVAKPGSSSLAAATRSHAKGNSGGPIVVVSRLPRTRWVAYSGARRQRGWLCQNTVCGMKPSARPPRSSGAQLLARAPGVDDGTRRWRESTSPSAIDGGSEASPGR